MMNPINRQISVALLGLATVFSGAIGAQTLSRSTGPDFGSSKPTNIGRTGACGTVTLTQSTSQAITAGNSASCNASGLHADNSYFRAFDLSAFASGFNVCAVEFGVETATAAGATQPVVVNVYSNTGGAFPAGTRTLVGTSNIALPDQTASIVNQALAASLPPGSQLVFEVFTPDGQTAGDSFFIGSNAAGESAPSYIQAADCGLTAPATTSSIGFPQMQVVMNVIGDAAGADLVLGAVTALDTCAALPSNNNSIIEPGEVVSISVPLNAAGGAFTNVVGMLTSATPGVTVVAGVGNYGNIASGGSATANYSIQVAESVACFSNLDLSLAVTSTEENFTFPITRGVGATASITYNNLPLAIPDNLPAGATSTAVVSGMPGPITSLQVRVATTHTWVGDLIYTLTSPGGTTITLLDQPGVPATTFGCNNNDVNVTFQDGQADPESTCDAAGSAAAWPVTLAAPVTALSTLNGQSGNGTWTLRVSDNAGGDTGTLNDWELIIAPAPVATCTVCPSNADMSITLTGTPDPVTAGTNLTYVATATNNGPAPADAVSITLPLPAGTTFVSAAPSTGGSCNAATPVVCNWAGATASGASHSVTVVAAVPASATGPTLSATATVASTTQDLTPGNNTATATTAVTTSADLLLTLTSSATQSLINVPVTFTATSLNQGPSDAQGVSITLTLTPDFRYSSHTATGATCTTPQVGNTGAIVCTWAGATAPGVTRMLTVVAFSNVQGTTSVTASTTSGTADPVANNNSGVVSVQVGYAVEEIPTLNAFTMILLGLMLGLIGFVVVRREA